MLFYADYTTLSRLIFMQPRFNLVRASVLFPASLKIFPKFWAFMRSLLPSFDLPSFMPQLRTSCMALLGRVEPSTDALNTRTEAIRELMLHALGEYGEKKFPAIARRVRYAPDVQGLWYARSDVMAILANTYGETVAREKIAHISQRFNGLLPKSLTGKIAYKAR